MVIGKVISETEIDLGNNFEWLSGTNEDINVPTIIVGLVKATETLLKRGREVKLLDRKIGQHDFWTFTRKEHRTHHANDLVDFRTYCYNTLVENVKYEFIDPLTLSDEAHTEAFDKVKSSDILISINVGDMVYMYDGTTTYGIKLTFYEFLNYDRTKLLSKIEDFSTVFLDTDEILIEYNDFMEEYENDYMYLPYLYSIKTQCPHDTYC